jgi:hypothetical protein
MLIGVAVAAVMSWKSKRVDDLPSSKEKLTRPTVYYLMGHWYTLDSVLRGHDDDLIWQGDR